MSKTPLAALLLAAFVLSGPGAAAAERNPLNVGIVGGFQLNSAELDLLGDRSRSVHHAHTGLVGVRAGYLIAGPIGLELTLGVLPVATAETDQSGVAIPIYADAIVYMMEGTVEPYAAAGVGMYWLAAGDLGTDVDFLSDLALGVRFNVARKLALRVEARLFLSDAVEAAVAPNFLFSVGLDFVTGGGPATADEVIDVTDATPPAPDQPVEPRAGDADGDGVPDSEDACPSSAGKTRFQGCPDTDDDGVPDAQDRCPDVPGVERLGGCPDSDGDGIEDSKDACPQRKGVASKMGCPGPGGAPAAGLPRLIAGVKFAKGKARLKGRSFKPLDELGNSLLDRPGLRYEVIVYTAGRGSTDKHLKLSHARAQAVVRYLVSLGVKAARLRAVGKGKASTRRARVELRRIPQVDLLE